MSNDMRHMFKIEFTSGHIVYTYECECDIICTAERLRDGYANYYNIDHDIKDISVITTSCDEGITYPSSWSTLYNRSSLLYREYV